MAGKSQNRDNEKVHEDANKRRARLLQRSREETEAANEIGLLPPVGNPELREACRKDLLKFLIEYFPESTGKAPFSTDHIRVIKRIEYCILHGGRFVNAVFRGFAKTTIAENAIIWAALYGHRRYIAMFGFSQDMADDSIDAIKMEVIENELLLADFPEAIVPFLKLENVSQRCAKQTYGGELTHIGWKAGEMVFPCITIDGKRIESYGIIITGKGLKQAVRGLKRKNANGENVRPDLAVIDDPQDEEVAASVERRRKLINRIKSSILKGAGHKKAIAVCMNATVIEADDVVEHFLSAKEPSWQGERIPIIKKFADAHDDFWLSKYADVRKAYDPDDPASRHAAIVESNELYQSNRAFADAGAEVTWEYCYDEECEISAIQHAYNALIDDGEETFWPEYQQQPFVSDEENCRVNAGEVARRFTGIKRGIVPNTCNMLTAYCDVHDEILFWMVCGWDSNFGGQVVEYGTWPDQRRQYFTQSKPPVPLSSKYQGDTDSVIMQGVEAIINEIMRKVYYSEGGGKHQVTKMFIDRGYKHTAVENAIKRSKNNAVMPSWGMPMTATSKPYSEYKPAAGQIIGHNWRVPPAKATTGLRYIEIDTNRWKSFVYPRLTCGIGSIGSIALYGNSPDEHGLLSEHLAAESFTRVEAKGRVVDVWSNPPHRDNHWFDCLVGCAVAASNSGLAIDAQRKFKQKKVKKKWSIPEHLKI